ncbi:hypothetical protein O181_050131 [Austropuccinia psidii MF-1]|uniref:Uncharacterized protein n=1 Tax=Austropuccinia psidii MF-1 TaxID=1389203 RepID=A0A9Q3HM27_9BASI|nr:hypothetical protein [Austropuccinia psidii MF-1]
MLANKHTSNACSLSDPCKDSFVVNNDESIPQWEWTPGPQTGRWELFRTISPVPSSINLSTPLLGHHLMVTSLLDQREVIIWPMKDGNGKRTFELGPIVTMSCHSWDSNAKPNPPQQHSPVPSLPRKQTAWQPTPGLNGTQWSEDLFHEPSQTDEPPIPGLSPPSSKPHKDVQTSCPTPPHSVIIIDNTPVGSPPPPLIPMMRLARNLPTYD